jgi:hypothetical protein
MDSTFSYLFNCTEPSKTLICNVNALFCSLALDNLGNYPDWNFPYILLGITA